jgi:DNA-binding transcriptional LysR family regulator
LGIPSAARIPNSPRNWAKMELRQVRYFLAVAQGLHFTRASKLRHLAQPALSQQIRFLEGEIGTWLFGWTNRRVRLTPAGSISIGFVSTAIYSVLPNLLRWFRKQVPTVQLELHELEPSQELAAIESGGLDMGMRHASVENTELASVVVSREQLVVALPSSIRRF